MNQHAHSNSAEGGASISTEVHLSSPFGSVGAKASASAYGEQQTVHLMLSTINWIKQHIINFHQMIFNYGNIHSGHTFNLPDFRGQVPVGVNQLEINTAGVKTLRSMGGQTLSLSLSLSLSTSSDGYRSHSINDPGHDHGGRTGTDGRFGGGRWGMTTKNHGSDQSSHSHAIPRGQTNITINYADSHTNTVNHSFTGSVGLGQKFSLVQPYQTVNYIIYAA
ncbi:unnamed protein product [Rotaria socialis]|uniref:Uncharacterized protein n=1 Tax=Rotaria socialis TaxID=392032 RepID=A0A821IYF9_9BILA|nr:unnamed protein product [Rotaria socialis]